MLGTSSNASRPELRCDTRGTRTLLAKLQVVAVVLETMDGIEYDAELAGSLRFGRVAMGEVMATIRAGLRPSGEVSEGEHEVTTDHERRGVRRRGADGVRPSGV